MDDGLRYRLPHNMYYVRLAKLAPRQNYEQSTDLKLPASF
jgi:hypothetical protein